MIIGRHLMVQLCLTVTFNNPVLKCGNYVVPMKHPISFLGQMDVTSCEMPEVVSQTAEPVLTSKSTEIMVKI